MKKASAGKRGASRRRRKGRLVSMMAVLLILYIGAQVISRTEGVRAAVADKISTGTRSPVSLETCAATPLLGLRLKGLLFHGVEIPDAKLSFNWLYFLAQDTPFVRQLQLKDAQVRFKRIPVSGSWEPLVLQGVGRRLGAVVGLNPVQIGEEAAAPMFPPYAINEKTLLQLRRAKVVWQDEQGQELASITDGNLSMKIGRFVDRKAIQTIVECGKITLASGRELNDFRLEAFRVEESGWVTVLEMSDSAGQYPEFASSTLWQDLNLHLNELSAVR